MPGNTHASSRAALRKVAPSEVACRVPGCESGIVTEDCCYTHSLQNCSATALLNDGVIDQVAIDIAVQGARPVKLTWVELDIALGTILAQGGTLADGGRILGINVVPTRARQSRRVLAAQKIAEALKP